jgi:Holliday junction resolvase RusA-like endonuclease
MNNIHDWSAFVNIEPISATHQSSLRVLKTISGRFFLGKTSSSKIKRWISEFEREIVSKSLPKSPIDGPISVHISFRFGYNKGIRKKDIGKILWKTTRPDLDNMEKSILDSLSRVGVITEDKNVVLKSSEKCYCKKPGIYITIDKLGEYRDFSEDFQK